LLGPKPAGAVGEGSHPGIVRIPLDTQLTERAVYPPGIALGNFDGAYTMATMYKSGVFAGNKVAFWGSEAGALKAGNYPLDEFVYVLEGDLVTTDSDGGRHEFHPGDAFVIPKGWAGTLMIRSLRSSGTPRTFSTASVNRVDLAVRRSFPV